MKKDFFVDFDGTITKVDTCAAMVARFAAPGWEEINDRWQRKEISTEECANLTFKLFRATLAEIREFFRQVEIDEAFPDFVAYCRKKNYRIFVLSDGYDVSLATVLGKYGIELPFYANTLVYNGSFRISCPYLNPECGQCGTCKSLLMEKLREEGAQVVYIGDGYSDTCPAARADVVFAKGILYTYCQEKGIPALPFASFRDIIAVLEEEENRGAGQKRM